MVFGIVAKEWSGAEWAVFLAPVALLTLAALVWVFMRNTLRTRVRVAHELRDDPDINEWLVAFNWSRKVLYLPTILVSFLAAIAMAIIGDSETQAAYIVGGVWLVVFALNFLVDEYEMSIKVLLILVLIGLLLLLWLHFLDWLSAFAGFFKRISFSMNWTGYLIIGLLFLTAVFVSWFRGLFYYVAITPNYLNIQVGPTETGEQISREEYSTRIDTGDFLERLSGFGRIVITFADQRRQPMILLVGRVGQKARLLESIRGKLAVDRHQPTREGHGADF